jgi:protein-S-isoprenylcysteine O-methyltransferase Ste14
MGIELLALNRSVVLGSAVLYWSGVWLQARRIRKRIGRSPNVRPRGLKEQLLWVGWSFVVATWLALPFLSGGGLRLPWLVIVPSLVHPLSSALGMIMMAAGYAGTLWCYAAMGNTWRMGVNRKEKPQVVTCGPYRFVRHPIYLCQIVMVAAIALLLPSLLSLMILTIHLLCVLIKAADEESFLRTIPSQDYAEYRARTGGWFPQLLSRKTPVASSQAVNPDPIKPAKHPLK